MEYKIVTVKCGIDPCPEDEVEIVLLEDKYCCPCCGRYPTITARKYQIDANAKWGLYCGIYEHNEYDDSERKCMAYLELDGWYCSQAEAIDAWCEMIDGMIERLSSF